MSSSLGYSGRLQPVVGRISTSFPVVLLEDPPVASESYDAAGASCRGRLGTLVAASSGSTSSRVCLTSSSLLVECSSSRSILVVVHLGPSWRCAVVRFQGSPLQPNVAPNSDTIFFVM